MAAPIVPVPAEDTRSALIRALETARAGLSPDGTSVRMETPDAPGEPPPVEPVAVGEDVPDPNAPPAEAPPEETPPEETPEAEAAPLLEDAKSVVLADKDGKQRKITFASPEDADLVRQGIALGMNRDEYHERLAKVEAQADEVALVRDAMAVDPVGFVLDHIEETQRRELAIALLLQPGVLDEELHAAVGTWLENPEKAELDQLKIAKVRAETRDRMERDFEARQQARATMKLTEGIVDTLSEQLIVNRDLRPTFERDMLEEVQRWAHEYRKQHGALPTLKAEHILQITQRRQAVYGISPDMAQRALSPDRPTPPRARPNGPAAEKIAATAEAARSTGTRFVAGAKARQVAAGVPGGGGTAAPTRVENLPPKKQNLSERVKWFREKMPELWRKA